MTTEIKLIYKGKCYYVEIELDTFQEKSGKCRCGKTDVLTYDLMVGINGIMNEMFIPLHRNSTEFKEVARYVEFRDVPLCLACIKKEIKLEEIREMEEGEDYQPVSKTIIVP